MNQGLTSTVHAGPDGIRLFLQSELVRRCKINPQYSLRAFARALNMESSALSKVLRGKRSITKASLRKISRALNLSPSQESTLTQSVKDHRGKSKAKVATPPFTYSYEQITQDSFQLIADWYHYAILELIAVQGFRTEPRWIAKKLGISISEVNLAVDRLKRLELLEVEADGSWRDISSNATNIEGEYTSSARKQLQKEILNLAVQAIDEVSFEKRDNSSMTMAIDSDLLPEARKIIKDFRRSLCTLLQSGKKKDAVYQLSVALIPAMGNFNNKGEK